MDAAADGDGGAVSSWGVFRGGYVRGDAGGVPVG